MSQLTSAGPWLIMAAVLVFAVIRVRQRQQRGRPAALFAWLARRRRAARVAATPARRTPAAGGVRLVAAREVRERVGGRAFRVSTLLLLAASAAAVAVRVLSAGAPRATRVGVVGALPAVQRAAVAAAGARGGVGVRLVPESGLTAARRGLRAGRLDIVVVGGREVMVDAATGPAGASAAARLASSVAGALGDYQALRAAGLTAAQVRQFEHARPVPVTSLAPGPAPGASRTLTVGLVLLLVMLTQYNTWTLIGVMEEKASRIAEVLLAAIQPLQLLAGKLLGIGATAFAQLAVVLAQAAVASGRPSALLEVLAYLPPTAPFAMPALVGLGAVSWWEFAASAVLTLACTAGVASLAAGVYRNAILRAGRRVPLRAALRGPRA